VLVHLVRRRNLRQRGGCSARPNPQHNPLNPRLLVALALLGQPVPPLVQGLLRLASSHNSNHSSNHSSKPNSSRNSSLRELGSVRLVKLNHSNRPASALEVLVPHSPSNRLAVSSVTLLSAKSPPPLDLVRASRFSLVISADTSKVLQLQAQALSVQEPLVRLSPRPPHLGLHPNNPRMVRSVQGDLAPVSSISGAPALT
jgi:hypothetical protein